MKLDNNFYFISGFPVMHFSHSLRHGKFLLFSFPPLTFLFLMCRLDGQLLSAEPVIYRGDYHLSALSFFLWTAIHCYVSFQDLTQHLALEAQDE